jgi:hypothetical protein
MAGGYGVLAGEAMNRRDRRLELSGLRFFRMNMAGSETMASIPSAVELTRGATKVGVLVPENERAMRLVVTDERYRLLDGSRFPSVRQAELTVQRLANFVDRPAAAAHAA